MQEGSEPSEQPEAMFQRLDADARSYGLMLAAINRANLEYRDAEGRSLTDLLARRDTLRATHSVLSTAYSEATQRQDRYSNHEIRWVPTMDVVKLRGRLEKIGEELRSLNLKIQSINWEVEVADPRH